MKYIVFPTEKLNEIPQEVLDELHLTPRKSVMVRTQVIMKRFITKLFSRLL